MNTLSATTSLITHSLAWALLYSLWQGLLIYATLFVVLKALPDINARIKYYLSAGSLAVLFLWFADTWLTQYQKLKGVTVFITQSGIGEASKTFSVSTTSGAHIQGAATHSYLPRLEAYFPVILALYSLGLVFMLGRFAVNILQLRALKTKGLTDPGAEFSELLQYWKDKFGINRSVQLFLSKRISVPMVLGTLKPMILLPLASVNNLTTEQVEAILMHELAHIKRHDYLLNIVQTIMETLLFFNPFVWLTSAIIRREREHCCDDMVVTCSVNPLPYARALAILEHNRISSENSLALAATGHKNQLFHRIKRIMEMKKNNINNGQLTIIIVAILAITFSIAMFTFTPSFAQKSKKGAADTTTKTKSVYKYRSVTIDSKGRKTEVVKESDKPINEDMNEDGDVVTVNISGSDDSDNKRTGTKTMSYSYSYSSVGDDSGKGPKNIHIVTTAKPFERMFDQVEKEMAQAKIEVDGVDWDEISAQINKSIADLNKEFSEGKMDENVYNEVKKLLEKSKKNRENYIKEIQKKNRLKTTTRVRTGNGQANAAAGNGHAEVEIILEGSEYDIMLEKMEKDGLIDREKGFIVAKQNGKLVINGTEQPTAVYNKYIEYLRDKSITIKGKKDGLTIDAND